MRRPGIDGGFLLCFGVNLILNAFWALPAVALFVAHVVAGVPMWLGWTALALWIVVVFGVTALLSWAASSADVDEAGTGKKGSATTRFSSRRRDRNGREDI